MIYTVEPLLNDTPNKGYLSIKGQALWSLQDHGNTILPLKEDNLSITIKLAGPKVSIIWKLYCIDKGSEIYNLHAFQCKRSMHTVTGQMGIILFYCNHI